jgi:RimJ/RimL family protein N-acetyltransferase/anti-anti-sigma regulatory factor
VTRLADHPAGRDAGLSGAVELCVEGSLHALDARAFCATVNDCLNDGVDQLTLAFDGLTSVDVVGIAALWQAVRRLRARGVTVQVRPSATLFEGLLDSSLLDNISISNAPAARTARRLSWRAPATPDPPILARGEHVVLRLPHKDDLPLFEQWANEPRLNRMVNSRLLYLVRHVGPHHPAVVSRILEWPSSLTVMIDPVGGGAIGFLRIFGVDVVQGFGFLETVVGDRRSMLKGWGIEASRLFVAYAQDALELRRVEAKTYAYNRPSINAVSRNGFREEGVLRSACVRDGRAWDVLVFSILSDEMTGERRLDGFPYMGLWPQ